MGLDFKPDPKPEPRIVDRNALRVARLAGDECVSCGRPPANVHHVIPKGAPHHGGDDPRNLLLICGSGSFGCHGVIHGAPYTDHAGKRWVEGEVRAAVGRHIAEHRHDTIEYVIEKLGVGAGMEYLRTRYYVTEGMIKCPTWWGSESTSPAT